MTHLFIGLPLLVIILTVAFMAIKDAIEFITDVYERYTWHSFDKMQARQQKVNQSFIDYLSI